MKGRPVVYLACVIGLSTVCAEADPADVCLAMVQDAAHNIGVNMSSSDVLDAVYSEYCETDGSTKSSSFDAGLSAIVYGIPVSLTGGAKDAQTQIKNFCSNYQSIYASHSSAFTYNSTVIDASLHSANDCLKILSQHNSTINYHIMTPTILSITFSVQPGQNLEIRGITHEANVDCTGSRVSAAGAIHYAAGQGQNMNAGAGPYAVTCIRNASSKFGGTAFYNSTAIVADTNIGTLNIVWPQETALPLITASSIEAEMKKMAQDTAHLTTRVNYNLLPIGSIIPWFEKNQPPPPGWAPCDGSDAAHCPNLTGLFLLGGNSSQVTTNGGSQKAYLNTDISDGDMHGDGNGWNRDNQKYQKNENYEIDLPLPPYMTVLYIIKIANS